jgi:hypothetical protein
MPRGDHCRCCGLGLALANFQGAHSAWNFYSWVVGLDTEADNDGWIVATRAPDFQKAPAFYEIDPWRNALVVTRPFRPTLLRLAYKVDPDAETFRLQIRLQMEGASDFDWRWDLEYEMTFADYDALVAEGRLRLNDYLVSATHSGFTSVNDSNLNSVPTNTQDGWGDFVLVWPRFAADWSGKRLVVTASTDTPIKNTTELSGFPLPPINLSWLETPFEFVFDQDSFVEVTSGYQRYYDDLQTNTACYQFFGARHFDIANTAVQQGPDRVAGIESSVAWIRFRTGNGSGVGNTCGGSPADGRVAMDWQIGSVWWKAFENDGVVIATEYKGLGRSASPVLHTELNLSRAPLNEFDSNAPAASVFPITYTLSLLPIE